MPRKQKHPQPILRVVNAEAEPVEQAVTQAEETQAPTEAEVAAAVAEAHTQATAPRSVVKPGYKHAYARRALERGATSKAEKRMNGDWLARELLAECMGGDTFDMKRFEAILDANGVKHQQWSRVTKGWQGRVRMSGSVSLRASIGRTGIFRTPDAEVDVAALARNGDTNAGAFLAKIGWKEV